MENFRGIHSWAALHNLKDPEIMQVFRNERRIKMPQFGPPDVEKMKAKRDVNGLIKALDYDKDTAIRKAAAKALGQIGGHRAVKALVAVLKDKVIHFDAAFALRDLGWEPQGESGAWYWIALREPKKAGSIGSAAVKPLIAALKVMDHDMKHAEAVETLGMMGDLRAVEPLIESLKDENESVRAQAAKALGRMGGSRAIEPLIASLKDPYEYTGGTAAEELGKLGATQAVEPLIAALKGGKKYVRCKAALALGQLRDPRGVQPLIHALKDEDKEVRRDAALALGEIRDPSATEPLFTALMGAIKELDDLVIDPAGEAMAKIGGPAVDILIGALKDENYHVRYRATRSLGEIGKPALAPLIASLHDEDHKARIGAVEALAKIGDARALEPLISMLKNDPDPYVRMGSIVTISTISKDLALEPLIATLKNDQDGEVREKAAGLLGSIGGQQTVAPLIAAFKDNNEIVRRKATDVMRFIGEPAVEPLIAALQDDDGNVRHCAAEALGRINDPRAKVALAANDKDDQKGGQLASYILIKTNLGNPLNLEVKTEKFCVYCEHLQEPNLRDPQYPKGVGECSNFNVSNKGVVSFDNTCGGWKANTKVRFWLSKGYMEHNQEGWPRKPWYQVFDDGPDGEKGTR